LACTNYKDIEIMINLHKVDFQNMESVADILLAVKGVVYHEGGHILHTLAFDTLFDCALMDNNVEPIVFNRYSDGRGVESMKNNYPAYLDDEVNFKSPYVSMELPTDKAISSTDTLEEVNLLKAGLSLHQHQFTKVKDWIRPAWNALEDGRMEDTLVRNTPTMAGYLEAVTLKLIVEPSRHPGATWPMVAARSHLSDDVYYLIRELAVDYLTVCGRSLTEIDECEKLVQNFRKATTPTEVVVASWQFANFLHKWSSGEEVAPRVPPGRGGHPNRTGQKSDTSQNPRGASTPGTHPYWDGGTGKEVGNKR